MGIYKEENEVYQIDLHKAAWSKDNLTTLFDFACLATQASVDWIAVTEDKVFLIEYKNYDEYNSNIVEKKLENDIVKKFYGSSTMLALSLKERKPIHYIAIIEANKLTETPLKKRLQAQIEARLPFAMQRNSDIAISLIADFELLTIAEWNEYYPMFPLERCIS